MSSPFYGKKVAGVQYLVFEQPLGEELDQRIYSIDANEFLKGRQLNGYQVTPENPTKLTIDNVSDDGGVIYFRLSNATKGYQVIKVFIPTTGEGITRHYCVQVKSL